MIHLAVAGIIDCETRASSATCLLRRPELASPINILDIIFTIDTREHDILAHTCREPILRELLQHGRAERVDKQVALEVI